MNVYLDSETWKKKQCPCALLIKVRWLFWPYSRQNKICCNGTVQLRCMCGLRKVCISPLGVLWLSVLRWVLGVGVHVCLRNTQRFWFKIKKIFGNTVLSFRILKIVREFGGGVSVHEIVLNSWYLCDTCIECIWLSHCALAEFSEASVCRKEKAFSSGTCNVLGQVYVRCSLE